MEESKEQIDQPPPTTVTVGGDIDIEYKWLEEQTVKVLHFLHRQNSEVSVRVVCDEEMSILHIKHSGVEGTTDVLTFDHGSDEQSVRADLAVCFDVAMRESKNRNHSVQNELLLYIVHGILHCIPYATREAAHWALMSPNEL